MQVAQGRIHRGVVFLHHALTALAVSLLDSVLDGGNGFLARQHSADGEETRLHDGVDAAAHAGLLGHIVTVDDVKLELLVDDLLLHQARQVVPNLVGAERAVQQEGGAVLRGSQHVDALEEGELVAGHETGLGDEVTGAQRAGPEAQVGGGDGAGLLGVVHEVALREVVGLFPDDLNGVLVGAHGAIGAQAEEQRAHRARDFGGELGIVIQAGVGDVVVDPDGEVILGRGLLQLVIDALHHGGREFLGREAVAAADHLLGDAHFRQCGDDVAVERLTGGARLLGAVENGDRLGASGQRGHKAFDRERPVQADLEDPDLLAGRRHGIHGLVGHIGARTHHDDDALGIRRAHVVEQTILPSHQFGELVHGALHDGGGGQVERVDRFAPLEIDIGILRGAPQDGVIGGHGPRAVRVHQVFVDHGAQVVHRELFHLGDFVGRAEAVEEVQERDARCHAGGLRDERQVHHFLHRVGGQHAEPGGAGGHDVAVVAENRKRLSGQRPRGDVKHRGRQLAGDLEHIRDHQQQSLRRRERGGKDAGLQRAMDRAGRASFALHLDHRRHGAPDVGLVLGGPLVRPLPHVGRWRNGINGNDFVNLMRYVCGCLVAVDGHLRTSGGG